MRILTFTNLYPSAAQPRHGIFVEHRIRQLVATGAAAVRVVAPVPWVPKANAWFGHHAALANVAAHETRYGIEVWHPRFFAVPKVTSWINPYTMALSALPLVRRLQRQSDFDLIDAHFVYPDGAAAVLLGRWLGKPVVVSARGTDINDFPQYRVPRAWIKWVTRQAAAMITVSAALRAALLQLEVRPERVTVLRNGVDLDLFVPRDRAALGRELELRSPMMLSVGHLIPDKGHQLVIEALAQLTDVHLVIAGDGPMRGALESLARRLGVAERISWAGVVSQEQLARYYAAADVTVLASRLEGMPNVLLESIACGTPVIASDVGGNGEIVTGPVPGVLMADRDARSIAAAYRQLAAQPRDRDHVRKHAEKFGWAATTHGLLQLFAGVIEGAGPRTAASRESARAA